jgi:hypothetical protein
VDYSDSAFSCNNFFRRGIPHVDYTIAEEVLSDVSDVAVALLQL